MLIDVENAMMYAVCSGIEREDVGNPDNVAVVRNVMVGFDSGIGINVVVGVGSNVIVGVVATVGVGPNVVATVGVGPNVGPNVGISLDEDITDNDTEYCVTLTEPTMEIYFSDILLNE
jgi:hypothetical protein